MQDLLPFSKGTLFGSKRPPHQHFSGRIIHISPWGDARIRFDEPLTFGLPPEVVQDWRIGFADSVVLANHPVVRRYCRVGTRVFGNAHLPHLGEAVVPRIVHLVPHQDDTRPFWKRWLNRPGIRLDSPCYPVEG